jgi:hypothetical protein
MEGLSIEMVMRRFTLKLVALILLAAALMTNTAIAQRGKVWVAGQTVDERGQPLPNVRVSLYYPPCRDCIDQVFPGTSSDSDGLFFLDVTGYSKGLKLYLEETPPRGFWTPFYWVLYENRPRLPVFRAIPLRQPKAGKDIELGRVVVKLRYAKVKIELPALLGAQYEASQAAASNLKFILRDYQKKIIYDGYLPDAAFAPTFSAVNLALPQGRWFVNFSVGEGAQRINSPQLVVEVDRTRNASVVLNRGNRRQPVRRTR